MYKQNLVLNNLQSVLVNMLDRNIKVSEFEFQSRHYIYLEVSVVIVVENGLGDTSSNPERD